MKRFADDGMRLTDCCGADSTWRQDVRTEQEVLTCRACYKLVKFGEGDGSEYETEEQEVAAAVRWAKLARKLREEG